MMLWFAVYEIQMEMERQTPLRKNGAKVTLPLSNMKEKIPACFCVTEFDVPSRIARSRDC